ncbi:MAG: FISUMP domain-containing protein, partial [Patescibacteria group bacterium]
MINSKKKSKEESKNMQGEKSLRRFFGYELLLIKRHGFDALLFAVFLILIWASIKILGLKSIFLVLLLLADIAVYVSYRYSISIPGIAKISAHYIRISTQNYSQLNSRHFRFKLLYYLTLLIHDIDSGFGLIINQDLPLGIDFNKKNRLKTEPVKAEYLKESLKAHHYKKKKATFATITASLVITVLILSVALLITGNAKAATYDWIQTSWSGGADTVTVATHPDDKTDWNKYYSKDGGIEAGSIMALSLYASTSIDTLSVDFNAGTASNTYISSTGAVILLKIENASCSIASECANGACVAGQCYACGTSTVAYEGGPWDSAGTSTSTDGYYRTVAIGDQCWFKDNLNIGTAIGSKLANNSTLQNQTDNEVIEKYCYSYIQQGNAGQITAGLADCVVYGGLYQWPEAVQYNNGVTLTTGETVTDGNIQGICPTGWHIPSDTEFSALSTYLGGDSASGDNLKAVTTWNAPNTGADNSSGFTALASGIRFTTGLFTNRGEYSYFWASSPKTATLTWRRLLSYNGVTFSRDSNLRTIGFSVRCLKDSVPEAQVVSNSGTFTSAVKNLDGLSSEVTLTWSASVTPGTSAVVLQVRSGSTDSPVSDSDPNWTAWTETASGVPLAEALLGRHYLQYRAILSSTDLNNSPSLDEITLDWTAYPSSASLISSPYDSGSASNIIPKITWTATNTSTLNTVKFQIRSAAATSTLSSAPWCGFADTGEACTGDNYFDYAKNGTQITDSEHPLISGGDDRYFQYRIELASGGTSTPTVSSVTVTYVVNAAPEFTTTTSVSQRSPDGKVQINYSALDSDTASSGVSCPDCVIASFRYSIDDGTSWTSISEQYLSAPEGADAGYATTTIGTATSTYSVLWDAKSQINGIYSTTTKIEITLNDLEGGNNLVVTTTEAFTLDVANPDLGAKPIIVKANGAVINGATAQLTLDASDDTLGLQMCLTLDSTYASCNYTDYDTAGAIILTADPKRVYASFKDAYGNISTASALTPETPNNIIIKDVSDVEASVYQEFIVWKAIASTTFKYYHVEHSTDGVAYEELDLIDNSSINFYFHQGLTNNSYHYYRIYTENTNGDTSFYTNIVSDATDGVGGTNPNPPILTNVEVTATTTQSATIEWDTNELANSSVHYSTDLSFNITVGSLSMAQDATHIGRHQVVLTNLTPGQSYNFTVESENALGISGVNTNESLGYPFDTISGPVISNVTANNLTNNSATIVWNTNLSSDSAVYYTTSSEFTAFENAGVSTVLTNHEVTISGLTRGTVYYYYVKSGVATDDNAGVYYSFTTPYDNVAPVISNTAATIVIDTQALINWTTNELSDSEVVYGTESNNYTLNSTDANLALKHSIVLPDLATSTTYYYKVISSDASSNEASSTEELSFTTLETLSQESAILLREAAAELSGEITGAANVTCGGGGGGGSIDRSKPVISDIKISEVEANGAVISWSTNKAGSSIVRYGTDKHYGNAVVYYDNTKNHSVPLKNLDSSTEYNYLVDTIDGNGNIGTSVEASFVTTDILGLAVDANGNPAITVNEAGVSSNSNDNLFSAAMVKAASYITAMAGKVSVNTLESNLTSNYNLIRQLSSSVPAPLLSGEPRVLTTADTATVTWSTDKEANSLVALAPEGKYNPSSGDNAYVQTVGNPNEAVTKHTVL